MGLLVYRESWGRSFEPGYVRRTEKSGYGAPQVGSGERQNSRRASLAA